MPILVSFVDPAPDVPGFLLPVFRRDPGANMDLAQVVDHEDWVRGFLEIAAPGGLLRHSTLPLSIEIGDPALWAFKDHLDRIHVANSLDMAAIATELLQDSGLMEWPLVRLDLGSFRDGRQVNAELVQAAFNSVRDDHGEMSAEVWRDTEIFKPAVFRDINRHSKGSPSGAKAGQLVVLYRKHLNVFVEAAIYNRTSGIDWTETRHVLGVFGLSGSEIYVRRLGDITEQSKRPAVWTIIGVGGVARHVVQESFFGGQLRRIPSWIDTQGIEARGLLSAQLEASPASQFMAVCQSAEGQIEAMAREVADVASEIFVRHLVNVRPFSFGSPPPRKTSVDQLPMIARGFDHVWIVAGHRQRRTGRFRNQFSVSNFASRHVKVLLKSLIRRSDLATRITNEGTAKFPSLNLFGMLRPRSGWSERETMRMLLHTMLCEELLLHTSEQIFVLIPGDIQGRIIRVKLGTKQYQVQLIADPRTNKSGDLIAWAISAEVPSDAHEAFWEFCIGLFDGYGWDYRGRVGESLTFEDEGEAINVWPAQSIPDVMNLISRPSSSGPRTDVILTPQSTPEKLIRQAKRAGWSLLHYSELPPWLRVNYRSGRFSESERQKN